MSSSPYTPLKAGQFRLVKIFPGGWSDSIVCELQVHNFEGRIRKYRALSYAWGLSKAKDLVHIGAHALRITSNLELALRLLRRTDEAIFMWIDALTNMAERSDQVTMMRDIFAGAEEVVVYLGHPWLHSARHSSPKTLARLLSMPVALSGDLSPEKLQESCDLQQLRARHVPGEPFAPIDVLSFISILSSNKTGMALLDQLSAGHDEPITALFEGVRILATSSWWTRVWVLQEVTVHQKVSVLYGNVMMSWDTISSVTSPYYGQWHLPPEYGNAMLRLCRLVGDINRRREQWREPSEDRGGLLSALREFSDRKASDDRDRVYALLGLLQGKTKLVPNYSIDVRETYTLTTLDILAHGDGTLKALCGDLTRKGIHNLPSWVPDWSAPYDEIDLKRSRKIGLYNAATEVLTDPWTTRQAHVNRISQYLKFAKCDSPANARMAILNDCYERLVTKDWNTIADAKKIEDDLLSACQFNTILNEDVEVFLGSNWDGEKITYSSCIKSDSCRLYIHATYKDHIQNVYPPLYPLGMADTAEEVYTRLKSINVSADDSDFFRTMVCDLCFNNNEFQRIKSKTDIEMLQEWYRVRSNGLSEPLPGEAWAFDMIFLGETARRRLFRTKTGAWGWGPLSCERLDMVWVLPSGNTPFVLRELPLEQGGNHRRFRMVGDCFRQGLMGGDAMPNPDMFRDSRTDEYWAQEFQWSGVQWTRHTSLGLKRLSTLPEITRGSKFLNIASTLAETAARIELRLNANRDSQEIEIV